MKERELALQTGISVSTIYQYIDGRMLPTIGAFLTIAKVLDVPTDILLCVGGE